MCEVVCSRCVCVCVCGTACVCYQILQTCVVRTCCVCVQSGMTKGTVLWMDVVQQGWIPS